MDFSVILCYKILDWERRNIYVISQITNKHYSFSREFVSIVLNIIC